MFLWLHRLLFELNSEADLNFVADAVAQSNHIGSGGVASIDQRQGVTRGDSGVAEDESFGEPCFFEQPRRREFDLSVSGWPVGNFAGGDLKIGSDMGERGGRNDGVLEERACAAAVRLSFDDKHPLAVTDGADSMINIERCRRWTCRIPPGEVAFEVGVSKIGSGLPIEPKRDASDDVTASLGGVKDAVAISEAALLMRKGDESHGFKIEGADSSDRAGDLLTVSTDILYGSAADRTGNSGHALDAADSLLADVQHKVIPAHSSADAETDRLAIGNGLDGINHRDMDDEPIEAFIADEQVAASAKNKDFEAALAGELDGFEKLLFASDLAQITRRAADAKGGKRSQRNLLLYADRKSLHGLESTTPAGIDWRGTG